MVAGITATNNTNWLFGLSKSSNSNNSAKELMKKILDKSVENYAESYDKTCKSSDDEKKNVLKSLVSKADKDGDGALSLSELSSLDPCDDVVEKGLVNDLIREFRTLDTNNDGKLSMKEMQELLKRKQFSQQELAAMAESSDSSKAQKHLGNPLGSVTSPLVEQLLSNVKS